MKKEYQKMLEKIKNFNKSMLSIKIKEKQVKHNFDGDFVLCEQISIDKETTKECFVKDAKYFLSNHGILGYDGKLLDDIDNTSDLIYLINFIIDKKL